MSEWVDGIVLNTIITTCLLNILWYNLYRGMCGKVREGIQNRGEKNT